MRRGLCLTAWLTRCACRTPTYACSASPRVLSSAAWGWRWLLTAMWKPRGSTPSWRPPWSNPAWHDGVTVNSAELIRLLAWADDSSLRLLMVAAVAVLLALLVYRMGGVVLVRLTRSMPVAAMVVEHARAPAQLLL